MPGKISRILDQTRPVGGEIPPTRGDSPRSPRAKHFGLLLGSSRTMSQAQIRLLRIAFVVGVVTDAAALVPLLSPRMASVIWGFEDSSDPYRFAMGYAAALMAGWTLLLFWAYRDPESRAGVAALTVFVIYGLVAAEVFAVARGTLSVTRMIPTWCLQAALLALFGGAYHYERIRGLWAPSSADPPAGR